jgi:hypothetical protein
LLSCGAEEVGVDELLKFPRTPHLQGSRRQPGDEDLESISFQEIAGRPLAITEKVDGANCGIRFTADGRLLLQSRGHYLTGGERERQFHLLKAWANRYAGELWAILADRYLLYGEWLYAKHTIYYAELPHYFLEFDLYDTEASAFLDTRTRREVLAPAPFLGSIPVLHEGIAPTVSSILDRIGPSPLIGADALTHLREQCHEQGLDAERALQETDRSGLMEGLYVKVEERGVVTARCKYVRPGFRTAVVDSQSHWMNRPLIPNRLRPGSDLF